MSQPLIYEADALAQSAREGLLVGELAPMAAWLRSQNSHTANLLADKIEAGNVTLQLDKSEKADAARLRAGRFIAQLEQAGVARKQALFLAVQFFQPEVSSIRVAERSKRQWESWCDGSDGEHLSAAFEFLMTGLEDQPPPKIG